MIDGLIGCQTPRLSSYPDTTHPLYSTTLADDAYDLAELLGYDLLPWQEDLFRRSYGKDARDKWAARSVLLIITRQQGKALDCLTDVLTANRGWTTMGDIRVGDFVFGPDGREREVTYASPVMRDHECFRVTTTDGRSVIADADHLWTVTDRRKSRSRGTPPNVIKWFEDRTITTREMFDTGTSRYASGGRESVTGGKRYKTNEYRYRLPHQDALSDLPKRQLPIDPYLFGAWLGDGSKISPQLFCHENDVPHWCATVAEAGFTPKVLQGSTAKIVAIGSERIDHNRRVFPSALKALGVWDNKHIPDSYLLAGDKQREALLQGLLDTDGSCDRSGGQIEFCSISRRLADGVLFLARSLGWRAVLNEGRATLRGVDHGPKYRVQWTPKLSDPYVPFRLPRKLANVGATDGNKGRHAVSINSIVPVESVPVRCIKVNSEDGLFLAGRDLIVTHNTELLEARAATGLVLLNERIIYTSQQAKTNTQAWISLKGKLTVIPEIADLLEKPRNGGEEVSLKRKAIRKGDPGGKPGDDGGFVRYITRSKDSGRGFTEIDLLMYDEAYALTDVELGALFPTQSASRNAQTWYVSSAGTVASEVLSRLRDVGKAQADGRMLFGEWSLPEGSNPGDRSLWPVAKPSLGAEFCTLDELEVAFEQMSYQDFAREHQGMWDDPAINAAISLAAWDDCKVPEAPDDGLARAICIDVSPTREKGAIAIAEWWPDGRKHVEIVAEDKGTNWILPTAQRLIASSNPPKVCVVQSRSQAGVFGPELEQIGYKVNYLGVADILHATMRFEDDIYSGMLTHIDDDILLAGLAGAVKYYVGDSTLEGSWKWGRKNTSIDITGIVACSYASHVLTLEGVQETVNAKKPGRLLISGNY